LEYDKQNQRTRLKYETAIQPEEKAEFRLAWPADELDVPRAIELIQWFGTLGGRSRNAWGSIDLRPLGSEQELARLPRRDHLLKSVTQPLDKCLEREWPAAIGRDEQGPLVWQSKSRHHDWHETLKHLAEVKIAFRTDSRLSLAGIGRDEFADRHLLAYPVTNHPVRTWGNQSRLANQLRFKVVREDSGLRAIAFHLPCSLPESLSSRLRSRTPSPAHQLDVWRSVHRKLDSLMDRI
jgi:CRISPR-associated protein Cmr1